MTNILNAAVYCGTYRKYNNGSIDGKWLKLADYTTKRNFLAACRELHKDEHDPEFMYQDQMGIPEGLFSESHIDDEVWHVINSLKKYAPDRADEFAQWCDDNGAEQDYKALREFLNFKPKQETTTNKIGLSDEALKQAIMRNCTDKDTVQYLLTATSTAAYIGDKLAVFTKPTIETRFCFDDENEEALHTYYNFTEEYFIDKNLDCNELRLLNKGEIENLYMLRRYQGENIWCVTSRRGNEIECCYGAENCEKLTAEQEQVVQAILLEEKEKFMKRLQGYLKRYGLSKIKKWAYWANE